MLIGLDITFTGPAMAPLPPVNLTPPQIAGATGLGGVLSVDPGIWAGSSLGFSYQWQRDGADIADATGPGYTLAAGDDAALIRCLVAAANGLGSAEALSNAVQVEDFAAPSLAGLPTISGTPEAGQLLTATPAPADGNPAPARSWQWCRAGQDITGATGPAYRLQSPDIGATVTVIQTETSALGAASAESAATGPVQSTGDLIAPVIDAASYADAARALTLSVTEADTVPVTIYWAMAAAPAAPSIPEIKTGAGGGIVAAGSFTADAGSSQTLINPVGASIGSAHIVVTDGAGNDSAITTVPGLVIDDTPPALSAATATATGQKSADWAVTSTEAGGTIFAAIRLAADAVLSRPQIEAGGGMAVAIGSDPAPTADAGNGGSFANLGAGTSYVVDLFQRDSHGNDSAVASTPVFTTNAAAASALVPLAMNVQQTGAGASVTHDLVVSGLTAGNRVAVVVGFQGGGIAITSVVVDPGGANQKMLIERGTLYSGGSGPNQAIYDGLYTGSGAATIRVTLSAAANYVCAKAYDAGTMAYQNSVTATLGGASPQDVPMSDTTNAGDALVGLIGANDASTNSFSVIANIDGLQNITGGDRNFAAWHVGSASGGAPETFTARYSATKQVHYVMSRFA